MFTDGLAIFTVKGSIQGCFDTSHDQAGKARQKDRVIPAKDVW